MTDAGNTDALHRQVYRGLLSFLLGFLLGKIVELTKNYCLFRLLTPEVFGQYGKMMLGVGFFMLFSDLGLSVTMVRRRSLTREETGTVLACWITMGWLLGGLTWVLAPFLGHWLHDPGIVPLLRFWSLLYWISALTALPQVQLERKLRFSAIAGINLGSQICNTVVAIGWAGYRPGSWALIAGGVAALGFKLGVLRWVEGSPWNLHFSLAKSRELWREGKYAFRSNLLLWLFQRSDQALIGVALPGPQGGRWLGYYAKASELACFPPNLLVRFGQQLILPSFSCLQHDREKLGTSVGTIFRFLAYFALPFPVTCWCWGAGVVSAYCGPGWESMVPLLQILAVFGFFRALALFSGGLFYAVGQGRWEQNGHLLSVGIFWLGAFFLWCGPGRYFPETRLLSGIAAIMVLSTAVMFSYKVRQISRYFGWPLTWAFPSLGRGLLATFAVYLPLAFLAVSYLQPRHLVSWVAALGIPYGCYWVVAIASDRLLRAEYRQIRQRMARKGSAA